MSTQEWKNRLSPSLTFRMAVPLFALVCSLWNAAPLRAQDQDVAEAGRQARERKAAQRQNGAHHVYTDEELKRNKILTQEDETRASSCTAPPSMPEKKNVEPQVANENRRAPSLGEVARHYRQEKAARQADQTAKTGTPSRYPMDAPGHTLAAPKPEVMPGRGSLRSDELKPAPRKFAGEPRNVLPAPTPRDFAPAARNVVPIPRTVAPATPNAAPMPRNNFPTRVSPFAPREGFIPRGPQPSTPLAALAGSLTRQRVQPGDSWWKLASRYFGKGSRWEELLRVNPGLSHDPGRLPAGTYIFVPGNARAKTSAPPTLIAVQKDDTLWSLAREHLGKGSFWPQLAAANPELTQFTKLQVGTKLKLPENATPVRPVRGNTNTQ
jgi:nucleoid-associated protein YgaU